MELLTHDELARLTPPERLALISQLWDSLEDEQLPLTAAQQPKEFINWVSDQTKLRELRLFLHNKEY